MASGEDNSELKPRKGLRTREVYADMYVTVRAQEMREQARFTPMTAKEYVTVIAQEFTNQYRLNHMTAQEKEEELKRISEQHPWMLELRARFLKQARFEADERARAEKERQLEKEERQFPERAIKRLKDTNLRQEKTIQDLKDEKLRQEETIKKLTEDNLRQEETNKKLTEDNLRQEKSIQDLKDENLRHEEMNKKLTEENLRTKQLEKYCFLYYWLHSDCHVSLETPARTYVSIHPPDTKGSHPNQPNVVQSLEEDIKRLGNPTEIMPLVGLNADEIDEWYKTIDVHFEQWTDDYRMLETALVKGSDDFKNYLEKHKPSIQNKMCPLYIYSAAWDHTLTHCDSSRWHKD